MPHNIHSGLFWAWRLVSGHQSAVRSHVDRGKRLGRGLSAGQGLEGRHCHVRHKTKEVVAPMVSHVGFSKVRCGRHCWGMEGSDVLSTASMMLRCLRPWLLRCPLTLKREVSLHLDISRSVKGRVNLSSFPANMADADCVYANCSPSPQVTKKPSPKVLITLPGTWWSWWCRF